MEKNRLVQALQQNKKLRSRDEVSAFDSALASLAQSANEEDLPDLLDVFTDNCQEHEVMFGLVHVVESFDMEKQLAALLEAVPAMMVQAPEWAKILHYRILNDDASRQCYEKLYRAGSPKAKDAAKELLLAIQADDPHFSSGVRQILG